MNIKNGLAIAMIVGLIIAVSSLVATIFALPFLIFLAIFILAFAKPSKHDINRIRAGLGLNENQAMALIVLTPLLTYLVISSFGMAIMLPNDHTINPYHVSLRLNGSSLQVTESLTYKLTGDELATELGRYLPNTVKQIHIECPPGMTPYNYSLGNNMVKVGCKSEEGHLKRGDYTIVISYTLPNICQKSCPTTVSLGKLELDAPLPVLISKGISAKFGENYITHNKDIILELGVPNKGVMFTTVKSHTFLTGLGILVFTLIILVVVYFIFGKERTYKDVPKFLMKIPRRRKPYEVNLAFYGDPDKIEDGAVIATILDLARKGYLKLKDDEISFTKKSPKGLDEYEGKVYWTLKKIAEELGSKTKLSIKKFRERIRKTNDITWLSFIRGIIRDLYIVENVPRVYDKFGRYLGFLVFIGLAIIGIWFGVRVYDLNYLWLGYALLASSIAGIISILAFDVYALGRYLPEFGRERAMWDAFRKTLNEYALIRENIKNADDLEEWLIYSNALGKPENVEQVILDTRKKLPNIEITNYQVFSPSFLVELIDTRLEELKLGTV